MFVLCWILFYVLTSSSAQRAFPPLFYHSAASPTSPTLLPLVATTPAPLRGRTAAAVASATLYKHSVTQDNFEALPVGQDVGLAQQTFGHFAYTAPDCIGNNYYNNTFSSTWCEDDFEYPEVEIETAIMFHFYSVAAMYKVGVPFCGSFLLLIRSTFLQEVLETQEDEETCLKRANLCPSEVTTVRPRRALNDKGQWKIIVNRVTADNKGSRFYMTQSAKIEICKKHGKPCPIIPGMFIIMTN